MSEFFKKLQEVGSSIADAANEAVTATKETYDEVADTTANAYSGAIAGFKGATVITAGTKEVHVTREQLQDLLNGDTDEIVNEDTATDDGYDKVRLTLILPGH